MNKEMILEVADAIEQGNPELDFDMTEYCRPKKYAIKNYYLHEDNSSWNCGSVACIAGWACFLEDGKIPIPAFQRGRDILGLNNTTARSLFVPIRSLSGISASCAVRVLRNLAKTGCVDWNLKD